MHAFMKCTNTCKLRNMGCKAFVINLQGCINELHYIKVYGVKLFAAYFNYVTCNTILNKLIIIHTTELYYKKYFAVIIFPEYEMKKIHF